MGDEAPILPRREVTENVTDCRRGGEADLSSGPLNPAQVRSANFFSSCPISLGNGNTIVELFCMPIVVRVPR